MSIEFKDKKVQEEYDYLKSQEDELQGELDVVQQQIRNFERLYEREWWGVRDA